MVAHNEALWRTDPAESLSDWCIKVRYTDKGVEKTERYHVHKVFLGAGPRKSQYFCSLFQREGRFAESRTSKSIIELPTLAATLFPLLLDYYYLPHGSLILNRVDATPLHYMADYFGMDFLKESFSVYIEKDMTLDNGELYYQQALVLNDMYVLSQYKMMCVRNILKLRPTSSVFQPNRVSLFQALFSEAAKNLAREYSSYKRKQLSCHLSRLLSKHPSLMDFSEDEFDLLIGEDVLPFISSDAVCALLDKESCYERDESSLTSLQERCIQSLGHDNKIEADGVFCEFIERQTPVFVRNLYLTSMKHRKL